MASGASSLDAKEGQGSVSHGFIPNPDRPPVSLPTIPIPIDFENISQGSAYEGQPPYLVVPPPTYDSLNPPYDPLGQSQYEKQTSENFKQQCDKALIELKTVRRQHSETSRRCDHAMKELDYFRSQHKVAMSQLEVSNQEASNLRGKYGELLNDKQRLEKEVQRLQENASNANNSMGVNVNNGEPGDTALMHTFRKYDSLKEEYDCLRKRYDEIIANHNATAEQLQVLQDENSRLKAQSHEITQERNSVIRERNGLKQQCTAAIRQWDLALRERNDYRDALGKVSSQHEEAVREMNQAMGVRVKATKDIKRLTEERNAAMHEYSLIMSERDTVHKEMEKLSEDLQHSVKRAQAAETELANSQRERHALALQAESLRREIASALLDRDRALKECSDLTRNAAQNQPNSSKMRLDSSVYHHGHSNSGTGKDSSNGGQLGADANIDKLQGLVGMVLNPRHKERVDNLETANQELDRLRKTIDKLQSELNEALQEAEVSKRRRDWAFSERDKIVSERESIRTLCDKLRKERDRAVSDLAEALRDSDDIKKQRNEAFKELKELKEKLETELEKDNGSCGVHSPIAHNHSRDSAIDADLQQSVAPDSDTIPEVAELDSVLESYHGKSSLKESSTNSVLKRSIKRRNKENSSQDSPESSKNRGTWPKVRSNVILQQNPTGTIVQSRSKKERPDLSILIAPTKLQQNEQQWSNRNSNPIPNSHMSSSQVSAPMRHSVYNKSSDYPTSNQTLHFSKPVPLSIHNSFSPPSMGNYEKMRSIEKEKHLPEFVEHDITPNRLSRNLNPSDDSLDYPTVIRDSKSPNSLDFIGTSNKGPSSFEYVSPLPLLVKNQNSIDFSMKNHNKNMLDYYTVKKTKNISNKYSDNESIGPECLNNGLNMGSTLPSHSRLHSLYRTNPFVNPHPHHLPTRYPHPASPPLPMTQSQSGESIGTGYEIPAYAAHSHNVSDIQSHIRSVRNNSSDHYHHHLYEGGTFPRKKENQRFRIPSNPSVTSKNSTGKVSTGSIERSSERGSPTCHVEVLSPGRGAQCKQLPHNNNRNSMPECYGLGWPNKPLPGELRRVHIDKIHKTLGIQISCPPESGGVFVSTVNEHSVASQVGLQVGDQLLEVCGINMRSATYELAANVLRQCGNSITMLVQYNPDKYNEFEGSGSSSQGEGSGDEASVSGSPTPRNSPGPQQSLRMDTPTTDNNNIRQNQSGKEVSDSFLRVEMRKGADLGIKLVGGNAVGIFVHSVQVDSPAYKAGLRMGDQILEYNNTDLRQATAERAALELAKPADKVTVLVRHDLQRYHEIKDKPGDGFFIRTGFDRTSDLTTNGGDSSFESCSLFFRKDQVLFIDNTLINGAPGLWGAWNLDPKGNKLQWGTIPSRFKVEEYLRRSAGSLEGGEGSQSRRSSMGARRSFFKRKKQRDPKELASFLNTNLGWWNDSGNLNEELSVCTYLRVERLSYSSLRPLVVLGPLWECVVEKLVTDFPNEFCRTSPTQLNGPSLERALAQGKCLEPRKRGPYLECISLQSIKEACDKGVHCILDISVASVEKLHKQQIYPIILLIKFKSTKQIKEVKDTRYPMEKVSAKAAKEMYEHALKLETEYRQYISAEIVPAGINIAYICTQVKAAVDEEQGKPLWVPSQQT